jgi:hypothetical protein
MTTYNSESSHTQKGDDKISRFQLHFLPLQKSSRAQFRIPLKSVKFSATCNPSFQARHCPEHWGKSETFCDTGGLVEGERATIIKTLSPYS